MNSNESRSNPSVEKSSAKKQSKEKEAPKRKPTKLEKYCAKNKEKSAHSEMTMTSVQMAESREDKASFHKCMSLKTQGHDRELEEMTFTRNNDDVHQLNSDLSHPFSADVQSILPLNSSHENKLDGQTGEIDQENDSMDKALAVFTFKNETFDMKWLNKSSPIKEIKNCFKSEDNDFKDLSEDVKINLKRAKSELIFVDDEHQILNNDIFEVDLREDRKRFDKLRDFSSNAKEHSPSPVTIKWNLMTSLSHQLGSHHHSQSKVLRPMENLESRSNSVDKEMKKSLEKVPLVLSSNKKSSNISRTQSREELSERVSKFYFQKQTSFANENEAFDLIRKNLYPNFLNDKAADKERIRSAEVSGSKTEKRIVTPSKTITELFDKFDSAKKSVGRKDEK